MYTENRRVLNNIVHNVSPGMINNPIYSEAVSDPVYESIHSHLENLDSATQQQIVMQPSNTVQQNLIYFYSFNEQSCPSKKARYV